MIHNWLHPLFILIHLSVVNSMEIVESKKPSAFMCTSYHPVDILCNNGSSSDPTIGFTCVCYTSDGSLIEDYPECFSLVHTDALPALRLVLSVQYGPSYSHRHHSGRRTTNPIEETFESLSRQSVPLGRRRITYEHYLKRKISNILINYCQEIDHDCSSLVPRMHPENVVMLRLSCVEDDPRQFAVDYVVLKSRSTDQHNLTERLVIEPGLILAALLPKLQRTIPYTIVSHESRALSPFSANTIGGGADDGDGKWTRLLSENAGFATALIVIGVLVAIVYVIAALKAIRDRRLKRHQQKQHPTPKIVVDKSPAIDYGAMDENLLIVSPRKPSPAIDHRSPEFETVEEFDTVEEFQTVGLHNERQIGIDAHRLTDRTAQSDADIWDILDIKPDTREIRSPQEIMSSLESPHPQTPIPSPPRPPAPPPPNPVRAQVTGSHSMQLRDSDRGEKSIKKATTFQTFEDEEIKSRRSSTQASQPPTPPSMILDEDRSPTSPTNGESGGRSRATIVQVPVLIVPAMRIHRDDEHFIEGTKEYDDDDQQQKGDRRKESIDLASRPSNLSADQSSTQFQPPNRPAKHPQFDDLQNGNDRSIESDDQSIRNTSRKTRSTHPIPSIRGAVSEECLLIPKDDSSGNPDLQISSDTCTTSDAEGNLDAGGFHLLMTGIGYQPLRESDWSVAGGNRDESDSDVN